MSARSCTGPMTNTTTIMHMFTTDLAADSSGRELMGVIESLELDSLGASRPIDLARALQTEDTETDLLVGHYLAAAATDRRLVSLALVAVAPVVERFVRRSVGAMPTEAFASELYCRLFEQLVVVSDHGVSHRRVVLARNAVRAARAVTRPPHGRPVLVVLDECHDFADEAPEADHHEMALFAIERSLTTVVSPEDADLIRRTRSGEIRVRDLARSTGVAHKTLLQRRARAEAKLRAAINFEVGQ